MDLSILDIGVTVLAVIFGIFGLREGFASSVSYIGYIFFNHDCFVCGIPHPFRVSSKSIY